MNIPKPSPKLEVYLRLEQEMKNLNNTDPKLENVLAQMDTIYYELSDEDCVWLDNRSE